MAQVDYDIVTNDSGSGGGYAGGDDGYAVLHSSLSSSLAGEGTYCRGYENTNFFNSIHTIKSSVSSGDFYEVVSGKRISIRGWLRTSNENIASTSVGIGAKMSGVGSNTSSPNGYLAYLGNIPDLGGGAFLGLAFVKTAGGPAFGRVKFTSTFPISPDTWYKIRMDVIDNDDGLSDTVNVYTGVGATGSEVWTLQMSEQAENTGGAINRYIPWGTGANGWFSTSSATISDQYIDRFQIAVGEL